MRQNTLYVTRTSFYRMPTMDGLELLKKVKARTPSAKTILISAFDVEDRLFDDYNVLISCYKSLLAFQTSLIKSKRCCQRVYDCLTH